VAVALSFDVDNATVPLSRGQLVSEDFSRGMYGAIDGMPRTLPVLDNQSVPASLLHSRRESRSQSRNDPLILSHKRHEIDVHGWIHEHFEQ
jgi:hypothetical protein